VVKDLRPEGIWEFRQRLARRGLRGSKGFGVHTLNRAITVIRAAMKCAYELDLIDKPIKYNRLFDRPSATAKRKQRRITELENGKGLFEAAEEILMADRTVPGAGGRYIRPSWSPTSGPERRRVLALDSTRVRKCLAAR
jgi:hypothetical protein